MISENIVDKSYQECPICNAEMPVDYGYITWCECGYNIDPVQPEKMKQSKIDKLYERLGEKSGQTIFNKMVNSSEVKVKLSLVHIVAIILSTVIHFFSLAIFLFGIYTFIFQPFFALNIVFGLIFLAISWLTRPRVNKLKKDRKIISRDEMPEMYRIIDELADKMGVKRIDGILLSSDYNAWIGKFGFKRRTIVSVGIPLFSALRPEEQLSVLAHELGHYANKDLAYGFYVGSAVDTLVEWYILLVRQEGSQDGIFEWITQIMLKMLSYIPYFFIWLLMHLLWNKNQSQEYMADYRAAEVCGSKWTVSALEKIHYDDLYDHSVRKVALRKDESNVIDEFRNSLEHLPVREKLRLRLRLKNEKFKLNATHPPTGYRIQFIEKQNLPSQLSFNEMALEKIRAELDQWIDDVNEVAIEDYRDRMYY